MIKENHNLLTSNFCINCFNLKHKLVQAYCLQNINLLTKNKHALGDERSWVRERAVKIIGELRSFPVKGIRSFFKPLPNSNAKEVWELCTMKRRKVRYLFEIKK